MRLVVHIRDLLWIYQFVLSFEAVGLIYDKIATQLDPREVQENFFSISFGALKVFMGWVKF